MRLVNGTASYLFRDQLGSVRVVHGPRPPSPPARTPRGTIACATNAPLSAPFGAEIAGSFVFDASAQAENRGFIGQYFDRDAGLLYLNARTMDPRLGIFISPDWLDPPQPGVGTNRYAYSINDPVKLSDPNGNIVPLVVGIIVVVAIVSTADPANAPGPGDDTLEANGTTNMVTTTVAAGAGLTVARAGVSACIASSACSTAVKGFGAAETALDATLSAQGDMLACATTGAIGVPSPSLTAAAQRAATTVGSGSGPMNGSRVHTAFGTEVRSHGRGDLRTEVSYLNQIEVAYGARGSVRLDVAQYDKAGQLTAAWDLKTGSAALTIDRITAIENELPRGASIPIREIRP